MKSAGLTFALIAANAWSQNKSIVTVAAIHRVLWTHLESSCNAGHEAQKQAAQVDYYPLWCLLWMLWRAYQSWSTCILQTGKGTLRKNQDVLCRLRQSCSNQDKVMAGPMTQPERKAEPMLKVSIENGELVLRVPAEVENPPLSKSEKSYLVASTRGNQVTELVVKGEKVIVGMTAFIPAQ